MRKSSGADREELIERCLAVFVAAGTLDLSLDRLARRARTSKRMLVHYFGSRQNLEEKAMARLEERLRDQFSASAFPPGTDLETVVTSLWDRATSPDRKSLLLFVMDLSMRAWNGSRRAKAFYQEQRRLWVELLLKFLPDREKIEDVLQLFQGAALTYLITGKREAGRRSLRRMLSSHSGGYRK